MPRFNARSSSIRNSFVLRLFAVERPRLILFRESRLKDARIDESQGRPFQHSHIFRSHQRQPDCHLGKPHSRDVYFIGEERLSEALSRPGKPGQLGRL